MMSACWHYVTDKRKKMSAHAHYSQFLAPPFLANNINEMKNRGEKSLTLLSFVRRLGGFLPLNNGSDV